MLGGLAVASYLGAGAAGAAKISILGPIKHIGHALKNPAVAIGTAVATVAVAGVAIAGTYVLTSTDTSKHNPAAAAPVVTSVILEFGADPGDPPAGYPDERRASSTPTTPSPTPSATHLADAEADERPLRARRRRPRRTDRRSSAPAPTTPHVIDVDIDRRRAAPPTMVIVTVPTFQGFTLTNSTTNASITFTTSADWVIIGGSESYTVDPTCTPAQAGRPR